MNGVSMKTLVLLVALFAVPVIAQQAPPVISGDRFAWDYVEADLATYSVDRFEVQIDSGTWTPVGIPVAFTDARTQAGKKSYAIPFPATQPGNHTITIRACNPDVCSAGTAPFAFKLAVVPLDGSNGRIIRQ
jgi:hypothetical protein